VLAQCVSRAWRSAQAQPLGGEATLDPIVVTATRNAERAFGVPARTGSRATADGDTWRRYRPPARKSPRLRQRRRQAGCLAPWLRAEFADEFTTGSPPTIVASGSRLPVVPSKQAYGELAWAPTDSALSAALELQYVDKLYVNDRNTDAAPAYTVMNARVGLSGTTAAATLKGYARLNNLFDRNYAGSVIVGDTNGRFSSPPRAETGS